jgi:hypothetical protein
LPEYKVRLPPETLFVPALVRIELVSALLTTGYTPEPLRRVIAPGRETATNVSPG